MKAIRSGVSSSLVAAIGGAYGGVKTWDKIAQRKDLPGKIANLLDRLGIKRVLTHAAGGNAAARGVATAAGIGSAVVRVGASSGAAVVVFIVSYAAIEYAVLKIEEGLNRSDLRSDIMKAIEAAETAAIIEARRMLIGELVVVR